MLEVQNGTEVLQSEYHMNTYAECYTCAAGVQGGMSHLHGEHLQCFLRQETHPKLIWP